MRITSEARPILEAALEAHAVDGFGLSSDELIKRIAHALRSRANDGRLPADTCDSEVHTRFGKVRLTTLFATQIAFCIDEDMKAIYLVGGGSDR